MTEYRLILRPEPSEVPGIVRLRQALKRLLRDYGLRCIDVREMTAENTKDQQEVKQ